MVGQPVVKVVLDHRLLNAYLAEVANASASRAAAVTVARVKRNITTSGRVRSGRMRDGIYSHRTGSGVVSSFDVTTRVSYTGYQEDGIGPVVPVKAKVLRFVPKGGSTAIFRPRTRGFAGAHFFRDAARDVRLTDFLP